jgi:hypothetical protein
LGDGFHGLLDLLLVAEIIMPQGFEFVIQLVHQGNAGRYIKLYDLSAIIR